MEITRLQLDTVDSTNTYAKDRFAELADGTLVVSTCQTAGRGRLGRKWESPPGVNLYASLVIKQVRSPVLCGAVLGLAAIDTIRELAPELNPFLKWPNDVYLGDAKVAGILCESTGFENGRVTGIVAGIGLNVNMNEAQLAGIDQRATSLLLAAKREFNLKNVLESLEKSLLRYYTTQLAHPNDLFGLWQAQHKLLGQHIEVVDGQGIVSGGIFVGIEPDGAMILRGADGVARRFDCGDVRIDRNRVNWHDIH